METGDEGKPELLYSRERRLKSAGSGALFATAMHGGAKGGFFKSLVATRSLRFMLLAVAIAAVSVVFYQLSNAASNRGNLEGARYELQATWFEGSMYLALVRDAQGPEGLPRAELRVVAGPASWEGSIEAGEREFRLRLPVAENPGKAACSILSGAKELRLVAPVR